MAEATMQDPFTGDNEDTSVIEEVVQASEEAPEEYEEKAPSEEEPIPVEDKIAQLEQMVKSLSEKDSKWQSLYDKNLSQWEKVRPLLEQSPEAVQALQKTAMDNLGQTGAEKTPDPWEDGYTDWLKGTISQTVTNAMQQQMSVVQEQVAMQNLVKELKDNYGYDDNSVRDFVEMFSQPKSEMSLDVLVNVHKGVKEGKGSNPSKPLEAIRSGKKAPVSPGSRPSVGSPPQKEEDKAWEAIKEYNEGRRAF